MLWSSHYSVCGYALYVLYFVMLHGDMNTCNELSQTCKKLDCLNLQLLNEKFVSFENEFSIIKSMLFKVCYRQHDYDKLFWRLSKIVPLISKCGSIKSPNVLYNYSECGDIFS